VAAVAPEPANAAGLDEVGVGAAAVGRFVAVLFVASAAFGAHQLSGEPPARHLVLVLLADAGDAALGEVDCPPA
jgi:hypothetical protein